MFIKFFKYEEKGLQHPFNKEKCMAGGKWYYNFLKRHPDLRFRQPEATPIARASGFNKAAVDHYLIDKYELTAERIFNVDESDISTVQRRCQKVVGRRQK